MEIYTNNKKLKNKIKQALSLAKKSGFPCDYLRTIIVFDKGDYLTFCHAHYGSWFVQPKTIKESSIEYLASLAIHENEHIRDYSMGEDNEKRTEKRACLIQKLFLKKYGTKEEIKQVEKYELLY